MMQKTAHLNGVHWKKIKNIWIVIVFKKFGNKWIIFFAYIILSIIKLPQNTKFYIKNILAQKNIILILLKKVTFDHEEYDP